MGVNTQSCVGGHFGISVFLVDVSLKLHKTASCLTSLITVHIVSLQEALPTTYVLRHEFNNNAECSKRGE